MKITKFGHSCMLVEEAGARILIDPGKYSTLQNSVKDLDAVLITHEHQDHADPESIKIILSNNPNAKAYTNKGVGQVLQQSGIEFELLEHGQNTEIKRVKIEAFGEKHAEIYPDFPVVDDTGYMIAERFFYAGDAYHVPGKQVEILAWPVCGPWVKLSEALDYGKKINPKIVFPVHDAMLKITLPFYHHSERVLTSAGINFKILEEGREYEF